MAEHHSSYTSSQQNPNYGGYGYGQGQGQGQVVGQYYPNQNQNQQYYCNQNQSHEVAKAVTAVTVGGSLLVLSALTLVGTVIALTIATPLMVIFSPVLVPAVLAVALITLGFTASGGFGVAAISVLAWMYRYVTGKQPEWSEQYDNARMRLGGKAQEMKDRVSEIKDRIDRSPGLHATT